MSDSSFERSLIANPPRWPNGARCAVALTFDVDTDSMLHYSLPERAHTKLTALSWTRYDQIAIPRIVELYRHYDLKQTFCVPAWVAERYPAMVEKIAAGGHEIVLHGYLHELSSELERDEEAAILDRGAALIEHVAGTRPQGWRAPFYAFSPNSAELLCDAGFTYDSSLMGDDVPYLLRCDAGDLVEIPADYQSDDWAQYVQSVEFEYLMPIRAPARGMEVFRAEFEAAYACGGLWVSIWHPFVSGRLSRLLEVRKLIEDMLERGDVWIATLGEIAAHIRALTSSGEYEPRIESVPFYPGPIAQADSSVIHPGETE
ncbi:MAG: polysaccharide deacetylase [Solirubrobacteraceae bacterium]